MVRDLSWLQSPIRMWRSRTRPTTSPRASPAVSLERSLTFNSPPPKGTSMRAEEAKHSRLSFTYQARPYSTLHAGTGLTRIRFSLYHRSAVQRVISSAEMREIDRLTTERYATPSLLLMEAAADSAFRAIAAHFDGDLARPRRRARVLCGRGNNGGDGAARARSMPTT